MARNKYPEETVNRILDESMKLFLEKGYDHTTIQDIINHLDGLSKGAIYHHFKSKEEILEAATDRLFSGMLQNMVEIRDQNGISGRDKLIRMFRESMSNPNQIKIVDAAPDLWRNPQLLATQFQQVVGDIIPVYVEPIIREGVSDGSIQTEYPKELAEVLMILVSIWINPLVFQVPVQDVMRKLEFLLTILHGLNLDILDEVEEEMQEVLGNYAARIAKKNADKSSIIAVR